MTRLYIPICLSSTLALLLAASCEAGDDVGPLVRSLWLIQRFGTVDAVTPDHDLKLKATLWKALGKDGSMTGPGVRGLMGPSTFDRLAGLDGKIDANEARMTLDADIPESRKRLNPKLLAHAELLTTSFDMIDREHAESAKELVDWIVGNYKLGRPLEVSAVCTGNSRRSVMTSTMGNVAAAYYGMPEIRFHSGGTAPTAISSRSIACLKTIGVEVEPNGTEAPRGDSKIANPVYKVRWGTSGLEMEEFSKLYSDASNPRSGFAALMVCGEADEACPFIKGAALRVSLPYLDPKVYDDSSLESTKYAERRDDIGRLMLCVMMQARNRLASH